MKLTLSLLKSSVLILFMLSSVFLISGCEKDSPASANSGTIIGLWEGTMTDAITQPFFLSLKSDGTCTSENISPGTQKNLSYGIWVLNGTTFTCEVLCVYGYPSNLSLKMTFTGTFDSNAGTLKGSFNLASPSGATGIGTFVLAESD